MSDHATLTINGTAVELPILRGSCGEPAIDITKLTALTGYLAYDPGFGNTASCRSAITWSDGDQGILRYRGIPIEQFATAPNFVEVPGC